MILQFKWKKSFLFKSIFFYLFTLNLCCPCSLEARVHFLHVQKTAGTTLRLLLEMQVAQNEIYPYRNRFDPKDLMQENLISGHFPYWLCKELDSNFDDAFKITILRDPVERYLSYLRDRKKRDNLPSLESVMEFKNIRNQRDHLNLRDNAFCRDLADNPNLEGQTLLESAKQTLQKLDCVIFFDHFAEDVSDLFSRLGINLDSKDIPTMNFTIKEPVSEKLLKQVQSLNQLDMQLYQYAKTEIPKKDTTYPIRDESFNRLLIKTNKIDYTFDQPLNGKLWSYREKLNTKEKYPVYRWVLNQPAYIYFPLEKESDYNLYFTAQPLTQAVFPIVKINGKEIKITKLNNNLFSLYHGNIPANFIINDLTEISFYSLKSFFYRDIYPAFTHKKDPPFSFAVNRIVITKDSSID